MSIWTLFLLSPFLWVVVLSYAETKPRWALWVWAQACRLVRNGRKNR